MIAGAAFCPHPPALVPDLAGGAASELDGLRSACRIAIQRVATPGARIVVVGSGPTASRHEPTAHGSLGGYGVPLEVPLGSDEPGPVELPLSLTVGAWLLRDALGTGCEAVGYAVGADGGRLPLHLHDEPDAALLVMGDGSARRSVKAPGYLDNRAAGFDQSVAAALRGGDASVLAGLDVALGDEMLAAGVGAWRAVGTVLGKSSWDAELLYDDAPYGVGYLVAAWTRR